MKISGFTFVHNAIESGYPVFEAIAAVRSYVDEIVVVDMQSTDETREILNIRKSLPNFDVFHETKWYTPIHIIDGKWGNQAGETLKQAHSLYKECSGDIILHFEADEVYSNSLLENIAKLIRSNKVYNIEVPRLQIEQNFQRCRWYPEYVHRVWPKDDDIIKNGHTTNRAIDPYANFTTPPEFGFLWDITNCFRDNWVNRVRKQAELWHGKENYFGVPLHTLQDGQLIGGEKITEFLNEPHWAWKTTPFDIPDVLEPLVGMVKYEPTV